MSETNWISGRWMVLAGCAVLVSGIAASGLSAQVVKAPRYQGGFDAPTPQLTLPAPPPAITPHGVVVEDVVARVNDQIISRSDVQRVEDQLALEAQQNRMSPADVAQAQKDLLRDMIDEQLLLSKAKELGINADADVIRQLDEIRKKNKLDSMDALEREAQAQGVNWEDFNAQIRNGILKQKVVGEEVGRRLQMTEAEETAYYKEHLSEFQQPEEVKLSEILIPLPETATPAEINQGEAKANDIKTKIMQGADFADMAKKYSGGPSAVQGGDLGLFKRGALAKVLEDQVFGLKVGETTQPIRTRQGWLIMKVTEHKMAGPIPIKDVEPQIQEALYMKAMQPALRAYLTKLRENAYINIAPGFVDSGASADETVPAFTAYQPPAVKKKKANTTTARYQTVSAKPAISSPDTTGGRTITGPDAKPAIDPVTGMAVLTPVKASTTKSGKPGKKIKKEKIRFGQAPRTALPGGGAEDVAATTSAAPGAVMSTAGTSAGAATGVPATVAANTSADLADNPLTPQAPEQKKTRYAAKAKEVKAKKAAQVSFKKEQKVIATAAPASDEEKTATAVQAAPLGLNGDTEKAAKQAKKDKKKKVKGAPKERLADQPAPKKDAPAAPAPTANPNLAPVNLPPATTPPSE